MPINKLARDFDVDAWLAEDLKRYNDKNWKDYDELSGKKTLNEDDRAKAVRRIVKEVLANHACSSCPLEKNCKRFIHAKRDAFTKVDGCSYHPDQERYKGHSTSVTVTDATNSGRYYYGWSNPWLSVWNATSATAGELAYLTAAENWDGAANWIVYRGMCGFDTSSIPDTVSIISSKFQPYVTSLNTTGWMPANAVDIQVCSIGIPRFPVATAFITDINRQYYRGSYGLKDYAAFATSAYNDIPLTDTSIIANGGLTRFVLRATFDIDEFAPHRTSGGAAADGLSCTGSSGANPPKLNIIYTDEILGGNGKGACRTRSGRLYSGYPDYRRNIYLGVSWAPASTYSDDNGSTWSSPLRIDSGRWYDASGIQMAVDGGDNIHATWVDYNNGRIYYSTLFSDRLGWTVPKMVATVSSPVTPKIVVSTDNYVTIFYTAGTVASEAAYYGITSLDTGRSWQTTSAGSGNTACALGACADGAGKVHCVYSKSDGARLQIQYIQYTPSTQAWAGLTALTTDATGNQTDPDIAIDFNDTPHVSFVGRRSGDSGKLSLRYTDYVSGAWSAIQNLSTEATLDAAQSTIACAYDNNALSGTYQRCYVWCACRAYDAAGGGTTKAEIRATSSYGAWTSWGALATISNTALAYDKFYPGFVYQRWPLWTMPKSGYSLGYMLDDVI